MRNSQVRSTGGDCKRQVHSWSLLLDNNQARNIAEAASPGCRRRIAVENSGPHLKLAAEATMP
jgi:hypothetical protein